MTFKCNLCGTEFDPTAKLDVLPCGHYCHRTCFTQWGAENLNCQECRVLAALREFVVVAEEPDLVAEERRSVDDLRVELQELKRKRKEVWEKYEDAEVSVRAAQKEYKRAVAEAVFPDYILTEGETGFRKFVAKSRSALETYVNNLESRLISYSRRQLNSILRAAGLERSEI